jgi:hypothetical protein
LEHSRVLFVLRDHSRDIVQLVFQIFLGISQIAKFLFCVLALCFLFLVATWVKKNNAIELDLDRPSSKHG